MSATPSHASRDFARGRVVGTITAPVPGPTVICIGGMHGNEPAGLSALRTVAGDLATRGCVTRGEFLALTGNVAATRMGRRYVDRDLNRDWGPSTPGARNTKTAVEDGEQRLLQRELETAFARARGPVYVLDLHTTSGPGRPFTVFADTLQSRAFARIFPNPLILGLEEHVDGTLVDFIASLGHVAVAVEGGQHDAPTAVDNLVAAVWTGLDAAALVDAAQCPAVGESRARLTEAARGLPPILEVQVRHAVQTDDGFRMHPGFASFDRVEMGQLLACDRRGEVSAPTRGFLLMPLYQEQGEDGFFIVARVHPLWLVVSRWLRLARVDRIVHWLPGVRRDPEDADALVVDRRVARWVALEVLHLLGFRKLRDDGDTLHVRRRPYDRP